MGTRSRLLAALPSLAVLGVVLALRMLEPAAFQRAELAAFDVLQRHRPREYQPVPVRIVDLDDATLRRVGQWPWPRTRVAQLVDRLRELEVAVVAFDIVFAEPDRTSPDQMLPLWAEQGRADLADALDGLPDHDEVLAEAFARARVVTGFVLMDHAGGHVPEPKAGMSHAGDDPAQFLPDLLGAVSNLPVLDAAATGSGSFSIPWPESDGVYRRVPLLFRSGERLYPSLAAEALRVATGGVGYLVKASNASGTRAFGEATGISAVRIGRQLVVPTDSVGRVWVHYSEPVPERYVPAWQVLEGTANPNLLAGHMVFVGTSAEGLKDLRATPVSPAMPGVQLHAEVAEQALTGHYLRRPDWHKGAELLATLALGLVLIVLLPRLGALWCAAIGVVALVAVTGFSVWAFVERQWLVAPVYVGAAVIGVYTAGSLAAFLRTEGERREVRSAFGRYVSPAVVEKLAERPDALRLGGETREMSLLFCDVRGFTTISEHLAPEELTSLVNRFLTPMTRVILEHGGTIDKYMGDCIMAFWNAPLDDPDHATHACSAALAMERELASVNAAVAAAPDTGSAPPLRMGIGINTGPCCVGNFGSDQRFDYSAIGDEVNLASRLEGQSKTYGVTTIVGDGTARLVPGWHLLELDLLRVKGRRQAERVFALLGDEAAAATPGAAALREANQAFLTAYRKGDFEAAAGLLSRCRELGPSLETLWSLHAERLARLRAEPPPPGWQGVHDAAGK